MANASLDLNFNITIKVLDENDKIIDERKVHNKANRTMVSGILQFLQGVFNPSEFNDPYEKYANPEQSIINNAYGAKRYIPSCTGVGNIGVSTTSHELSIDTSVQAHPGFAETDLQQPLINEHYVPRLKFRRVRPTRGGDRNNSQGLALVTVIPRGYLLYKYDENGEVQHNPDGSPIYTDNYFMYYGIDGTDSTGKEAIAITEIGLFSNTDMDNGLLLARVLLDGYLKNGAEFTVTNSSNDPLVINLGRGGKLTCPANDTSKTFIVDEYVAQMETALVALSESGISYTKSSPITLGEKGVMYDNDYQYNPLIQTKDSSVIIEWNITITSIGSEDTLVVEPVISDMQINILS